MSVLRRHFFRLAVDAVTSRLGTLAASGFTLVALGSALSAGWADRRARSAENAPLGQARHLPEVLGKSFSPDVVQRLDSLAPMVLVLALVLMTLAPWLGAAYASTIEPSARRGQVADPFVRSLAALLATGASMLLVVSVCIGLASWLLPGTVVPWAWRPLGPVIGIALLACLPSVAIATAVRDALPQPILGVPAALASALALRYGLPILVGGIHHKPLVQWLVPRSYELPMLSVSPSRVLLNAALCLVWASAVLLIDVTIMRMRRRDLDSARRSTPRAPKAAMSRLHQPEV